MPRGTVLDREVGTRHDRTPDRLGGGRDDHERRPTGCRRRGLEDVGQHGPTADRVEDLGQSGTHPGAEARGQDDGDGTDAGVAVIGATTRRG